MHVDLASIVPVFELDALFFGVFVEEFALVFEVV